MLTRTYTRALADLSTARRDLTLDLDALAPGLDPDLVDTLRLCLHELHANACKYGHPHAPVVRHLFRAHDGTLTLTVHNRHAPGAAPPVPRVPVERTTTEWDRGRGPARPPPHHPSGRHLGPLLLAAPVGSRNPRPSHLHRLTRPPGRGDPPRPSTPPSSSDGEGTTCRAEPTRSPCGSSRTSPRWSPCSSGSPWASTSPTTRRPSPPVRS
ncbi:MULTISPECIES: ATP-binding protein [Nocardiopsidaceae]|uniref:ATP-binding protein n=1 Tax=Streptomonospora nanhaiensis TaxID=1323731 RepID=UPI003D35D9A6